MSFAFQRLKNEIEAKSTIRQSLILCGILEDNRSPPDPSAAPYVSIRWIVSAHG